MPKQPRKRISRKASLANHQLLKHSMQDSAYLLRLPAGTHDTPAHPVPIEPVETEEPDTSQEPHHGTSWPRATVNDNPAVTTGDSQILRSYVLPPFDAQVNSMFAELYRDTLKRVTALCKRSRSIALTVCHWCTVDRIWLVTVQAHLLNDRFQRDVVHLSSASTAEVEAAGRGLPHWVRNVWSAFGAMEQLVSLTTEPHPVFLPIANDLNLVHIPSFPHLLNEVVEHAIQMSLTPLVQKLTGAVLFLCHQPQNAITGPLTEIQRRFLPNLALLQNVYNDIPAWTLTHELICWIWNRQGEINECSYLFGADLEVQQQDWRAAEEMLKVFFPLKRAVDVMSRERWLLLSTAGVLVRQLEMQLTQLQCDMLACADPAVRCFLSQLLVGITGRMSFFKESSYVTLAMTLDPRNRDADKWLDPIRLNMSSDILERCMVKWITATNAQATGVDLMVGDEISRYFNKPHVHERQCPRNWWLRERTSLPNLAAYARMLHCMPACSVPCDQIYADPGPDANQDTVNPPNVNEVNFVRHNYRCR